MDGTVKDIINFCTENKLIDVEMQTEWADCLTWSVFLDEEHNIEIEYDFIFKDRTTSIRLITYSEDEEDCGCISNEITSEEALKFRGAS